VATKQPDEITTYRKEKWGYSIYRGDKQYGAAPGNIGVMAQFLGIDVEKNSVEFTETFVAPTPRPQDHFPPHVRVAKYGFGKAKS
jgi:hypothetical protein